MSSSSDRIASEFMAQGRPAAEPVQSSGARSGDMSACLEIKTPQFGSGFAEWAVKGYDLNGGITTPGVSDRAPQTPGAIDSVKVDVSVPVKGK